MHRAYSSTIRSLNAVKSAILLLIFAACPLTGATRSNDPQLRALESDVEASFNLSRNLKLDQELQQERLHSLEQTLEKMRREIASLEQRLQIHSSGKATHLPAQDDALRSWQEQTDSNIAHLQKGLQALTSALSGSMPPSSNKNSSNALKPPKATASTPPAIPSTTSTDSYIVKAGDSLEKIAKKNLTSVEAIKELNQLQTFKIQVGQKIKLPAAKLPANKTSNPPAAE